MGPVAGHLEADVIRIESALPPELFRKLRKGVSRLGKERLSTTFQTTFWFDLGAPHSLPEKIICHLRRYVPTAPKIIGAEWWLSRMNTTNVQVDFHRDRDEKRALLNGRTIHPKMSSVLFLNRVEGGVLVLTRDPPDPKRIAFAPESRRWDLTAPSPNRFVIFPGNRTHGVLDATNQIPSLRSTGGQGQMRQTLVINWWHRRPVGLQRHLDTEIYRSLADSS